jgi:signal transduction histidine kinase
VPTPEPGNVAEAPTPRRWERFLDGAAVIAVGAELWRQATTEVSWLGLALLAVAAAAVALRRRLSLPAVAVATLASALVGFAPSSAVPVWVLTQVCAFAIPLRWKRGPSIGVAIGVSVTLYVTAIARLQVGPLDPIVLILPVWTVAVVGIALSLRDHTDYTAALYASARAALDARESEMMHRVADERLRIARDLHDAVAHNVAIINVHAGAAERVLADAPPTVRASLTEIRNASRTVLEELQEIVSLLRRARGPDDPDPSPTTAAGIPALIESFRAVGMRIDATVDGDTALTPAANAAAYRVVQEALTNAHRHGTGSATIDVRPDGTQLHIDIENPVDGARRLDGSGFGLVGMRERVTAAGGTLDIRASTGRFAIHVRLPLAHPVAGTPAAPAAPAPPRRALGHTAPVPSAPAPARGTGGDG